MLWAAIDPNARFTGSEIGESRFSGYLKPFNSEADAKAALEAAGAIQIQPEAPRRRAR